MENSNNYYSQPQYNQQYGQPYAQPYAEPPVDPNYAEKTKSLLTKAIVACVLSTMPIASIVAIFMGTGNRNAVLDYINQSGIHTPKLKVCSALSRTATFGGIGYTIFWALYALYFAMFILAAIWGFASEFN